MPSPKGTLVNLSLAELAEMEKIQLVRLARGDTIQLSGAGKSEGKNFQESPSSILAEIKFARRVKTGKGTPDKSYFDVSENSCYRGGSIGA